MESEERLKFLAKISRLYYLEGLKQQEIADKLNISRTKISRFLTASRSEKIVEIKINSPNENYPELEYKLEKKFKIKECNIVTTFESEEQILKNIGLKINSLMERIMTDGSYIGIGWGKSLREASDWINIKNKSNIKVVPLIGGLGKTGTGIHTNVVAKNIADHLGGISYVINAPAVLDSNEAKKIIEKDSNTKEIMDMVDKIDIALVGMSDLSLQSTLINSGNFRVDEFSYLESLDIVGDVNLIFINSEGKHVFNEIDRRIVRAPLEKLKKIKNVIGVAFGERKLKIIRGALKGNIINILITDYDTAKKLIEN